MTVIRDIDNGMARIEGDARVAFGQRPVLMLELIATACSNGLHIDDDTLAAITENHKLIADADRESVVAPLAEIMRSPRPSYGIRWLDVTGLLDEILPEITALKGVETVEGHGHKDNFAHTLQVLDNVARVSDNVWLRWAALLHDIGKPATKRYEPGVGWTFRNHDFIGEKMTRRVFGRLRLGDREQMQYVTSLVGKHMRPQQIGEEGVSDSAVRRMITEMGDPDDLNDLMAMAEADLTSKNPVKVRRVLDTFANVRQRLEQIRRADAERLAPDLINGNEIMATFAMEPTPLLGEVKKTVNDYAADHSLSHAEAYTYIIKVVGPRFGLVAVENLGELRERFEAEYIAKENKRREREERRRAAKAEHDRRLGRVKE